MKKFAILIALLCMLTLSAWATPVSVVTGPYRVTFDMDLSNNSYSITANSPKISEALSGYDQTEYLINIQSKHDRNTFANINLVYTDTINPEMPTPKEMEAAFNYIMLTDIIDVSNVESAQRTIDNTTGIAGAYDYKNKVRMFMAMYYPEFDGGRLCCLIGSTYPWDDGTRQLLRTIHVDRISEN